MKFLSKTSPLARALADRKYDEPTEVQAAVMAQKAADRDLLVSAQTGSGKTVAYGLAIAKDILGDAERFEPGSPTLGLVVAPTRELALQVQRELAWLYEYTGARVISCVGGMDPRSEKRELTQGAHIVVGTPGRLCDHLRRKRLDVSSLKAVVLDEADEMLDLGFREDLEFILKTTPETRRTLMFSATLPRGIVALAKQYQKQAHRIELAGGEGGHVDIEYRAIRIAANDVEHAVVNVLRFYEAPSAIVFCNTRNAVNHLQTALLERGFSVVALSGELSQGERTHALQALRDGRARVCVATDVAARGIDLPNLGLVVHAEFPIDPEVLQHRSGRTGRAGKKGVSVMLVVPARRRRAELLLGQAGIDALWGSAPSADEIKKLDQQRMLQDALFAEQPSEDDLALARALLAERSAEDIAAALARLYRSRLPSPEDIGEAGEGGRSAEGRGPIRNELGKRGAERGARLKPKARGDISEGSVWFSADVGRRANAEARWLLPMICRRGGIDKHDIGAIRIYDNNSEFEISGEVAEQFRERVKLPDKEDKIVIEMLANGPQGHGASDKRPRRPKPQSEGYFGKAHDGDRPHRKSGPPEHDAKRYAKPKGEANPWSEAKGKSEGAPGSGKEPGGFKKKRRYKDAPPRAGNRPLEGGALPGKSQFERRPKKKRSGV